MSSVLGAAIETTGEWPDGLEYKFPRRELGRGRLLVWLATWILLGLAYWLVAGPVTRLALNGLAIGNLISAAIWSYLTYLLFRFPLWFCLSLLCGHREVGLSVDALRSEECVGGLRRSKHWPLRRLKRLQVVDLLPVVPPVAAGVGLVGHLHVLTGVLDDGKRIVIVPGYPRLLLDPFVEALSRQISLAPQDDGVFATGLTDEQVLPNDDQRRATAARAAIVSDDSVAETETKDRVEAAPSIGIPALIAEVRQAMNKSAEPDEFNQPPGSDVQVERFPEGITLRVPPAGIWKGSAGMFQFGILWSVAIVGFTILFLVAGVAQAGNVSGALGLLAMMSIFGLAGACMLVAGWRMGKRESVVAVVGESVMVMQTGLRRAKRREWPRSEVKTVRAGPSNISVNDEPVVELQIHGSKGKLFGMLAGRDVRELTWMATLLRQALKM
jgi:hypothetical protein